jgi:hypothetical protein
MTALCGILRVGAGGAFDQEKAGDPKATGEGTASLSRFLFLSLPGRARHYGGRLPGRARRYVGLLPGRARHYIAGDQAS